LNGPCYDCAGECRCSIGGSCFRPQDESWPEIYPQCDHPYEGNAGCARIDNNNESALAPPQSPKVESLLLSILAQPALPSYG
jgi:hypothetical protein